MHRVTAVLLISGLALSAPAASANEEALQGLLQKNNCTACHMISKRKYGPTLKDVAAKYANEPGAVDTLAAKIRSGGSGVWGEDMMPPQPHVSEAEARTLAESVLALK
jgi:cytochrome c